jgi:hypothetical protein
MKTWALLLFWIFGTTLVWGQKNKSGKISLKVVEINSQKPVPLASVGVSLGTQIFGGFTNEEGFIQISNLPCSKTRFQKNKFI